MYNIANIGGYVPDSYYSLFIVGRGGYKLVLKQRFFFHIFDKKKNCSKNLIICKFALILTINKLMIRFTTLRMSRTDTMHANATITTIVDLKCYNLSVC